VRVGNPDYLKIIIIIFEIKKKISEMKNQIYSWLTNLERFMLLFKSYC